MRTVRFSRTAFEQLERLLSQGVQTFGARVVAEKRELVLDTVENGIAPFPAAKLPHPALGLVVYPVSRTPFVVLYDYDDAEVRVYFVVHARASLDDLDPKDAEW